ncbi:hypothetical protein Tco_0691627 [Tanacetum coccineum]
MAGSDDENPPPPPPPQTPTQQAPHTVSTIKLPILKKGEYDIWAMKMEHYLSHTDYPIWEVIQKGNGPVSVSTDTNGVIKVLPPKTAEEILARERERKARTTLLMALPEDHLAKFHKMTDAKDMWDAIKSRFGGNDESKKMQKYILKQQFEGFSVSNSEGLHKGYDRFQSLLSQLEIHGAGVSTEDANQKFLRSLPSSWSQVSLVMRTKPGVDSLSIDDLYNNLRVFENDIKGSTGSSSNAQNVTFVSSERTSSTNDVSITYRVSTSSGYNSQRENSSSYTDELMYSFFANQSNGPHLDHEDLDQLDEFDLEEMYLKWQVAMISMRLNKFYKKTGIKLHFDAKEPVGFDKTKEEPKALVTLDGEGVDWTDHAEDEQENFALMAYSNSGSDTEVEAQLVTHQKNQVWYEEKIRFMKIDLDDKTDVLTYHKKLLAEAVKEKEELKTKLENFQSSSKGLSKLLNSQMSKRDKSGLGYGDQVHDGVLSYENEVFQSVFDSRSSDVEDSPVHDRFANVEGMHAVPPPMTGNYMPSGPDREVDDSMFTYGPKQSKTSESDTQTSNYDSCESNSSTETLESVPEQVVVEPNVVSQPKVWPDAPIIEEYESDSDDEYVIQPSKEQERPSFASIDTVKHVKILGKMYMTGNKAYLTEYQDYNGGPVAFGGSKGYITGKGRTGRKNAKPEPTLDAFDDLDADGRDYMETKDVVKEGRQSNETKELNKGSGEKGGSTKELVSTAEPKTVSTARPELSTARPDVDAARQEDSAVEPRTPPTTTSIFDDEDIIMAQTLIKMKEEKAKEKVVSIKDIEDSSRPARSILTLKPLLTIDPKDKGKSVLEEPKPAKKMTRSDFDATQIARDAKIARQLQVDLQTKVERERQREEEASKAAIAETYDKVQAGIDADALFAAKL